MPEGDSLRPASPVWGGPIGVGLQSRGVTPSTAGRPSEGFLFSNLHRRISSVILGRDSSLFNEAPLPPRRPVSSVVIKVLDSLPLQLFSLCLVVFTLFAADIANYTSAPDSADAYINGFLLASMAAFVLDIVLNIAFRPRLRWFPILLDIVATLSILIDVTWVADGLSLSGSSSNSGGGFGSQAASVTSKAGRIIRLVRVIRVLRMMSVVTSIITALNRRWGKGGTDKHAPSNIGSKLTDATTMQVALVVIITVIGAALLLGLGDTSGTGPMAAFVGVFELQLEMGAATREALQPLVNDMLTFASREVSNLVPMALEVGNISWSWAEERGGYSARGGDTVTLKSPDGNVSLAVDISRLNHHTALMDMMLIVFVVALLLLFVAILNLTAYRLLVRPLERIFAVIRDNAAQIVSALDPEEKRRRSGENSGDGGSGSGEGDSDMDTIEAAVVKMSRIVAHFTAAGGQGAGVLKSVAENADMATKEWLNTFVGGGGAAVADAASERHRTSSGGEEFKIKSVGSSQQLTGPGKRSSGSQSAIVPGEKLTKTMSGAGPPRLERRSSLQCFMSLAPKPRVSVNAGAPGTSPSVENLDLLDSPKGVTRTFLEVSGLTAAQHAALLAVDSVGLTSLSFDTSELAEGVLVPYVVSMFMDLNLAYCRGVQVEGGDGFKGFTDVVVLWRFVEEVSKHYKSVPYHNFWHAVDVVHSVYVFIKRISYKVGFTHLERLALMTAALCHDMEHPGVNNAFLVSTRDGLATTYNDNSVLENRHIAAMYSLLESRPDADIFSQLDQAQWREVRRMLIAAVLHTDMVHHFTMVSKVQVYHELHAAEVSAMHKAAKRGVLKDDVPRLFTGNPDDRALLLNVLLHSADIGNPLRPAHIARKWAHRVLDEFFRQGDLERAAGLPISPMCDRSKSTVAMSQINFIEFVVAPFYVQVAKIFPEFGDMIDNMQTNRRLWNAQLALEIEADASKSPADKAAELKKADARLVAFLEQHKEAFAASSRRAARLRGPMSGPGSNFGRVTRGSGSGTGPNGPLSPAAVFILPTPRTVALSGSAAATGDDEVGAPGEGPEFTLMPAAPSWQQQLAQMHLPHGRAGQRGTSRTQRLSAASTNGGGGGKGEGAGDGDPASGDAVVNIRSSISEGDSGQAAPPLKSGGSAVFVEVRAGAGDAAGATDKTVGSEAAQQAQQQQQQSAGALGSPAGGAASKATSPPAAAASKGAGGSNPSSPRQRANFHGEAGGGLGRELAGRRSSLLEALAAATSVLSLGSGGLGSPGAGTGSSPPGGSRRGSLFENAGSGAGAGGGGSPGAGLLRRGSSRSFTGANRVAPGNEGGAGKH